MVVSFLVCLGFIILAGMLACDGDDEVPELADTGFVWVAPAYLYDSLLKVGNNTGRVVRTMRLAEDFYPCEDFVADAKTGNIYVKYGGFIKKYDCRGAELYSLKTTDDFAVDESHDALWLIDWFYLSIRSAADGEAIGLVRYEPEDLRCYGVDGRDGGIWMVGDDNGANRRMIKYSKSLQEERTVSIEGQPEYISVNAVNGDVWLSWYKNTNEGLRWVVSRYSAEGEHARDVLFPNEITGLIANPDTGGCIVLFRHSMYELGPGMSLLASWTVEELDAATVNPATGDLYAVNIPNRREPVPHLRKIDGDTKSETLNVELRISSLEVSFLACTEE
jgi:hypothetical protein